MPALSTTQEQAFAAVSAALRDPEALLARWHSSELFAEHESDGLVLRLGEAAAPSRLASSNLDHATAIPSLAARLRGLFGSKPARRVGSPPLLERFLSNWNGYTIEENDSARIEVQRASTVDNVWNGFLAVEDVEPYETSDMRMRGLRFAVAYAQAHVLLVDQGPQPGAIVFDDGKGPPVAIADTLASFFAKLAASGMSVEAVVDSANV